MSAPRETARADAHLTEGRESLCATHPSLGEGDASGARPMAPSPKRPPTARQLALAADIANRFVATCDLSDEEQTQVRNAAYLMGMSALASVAGEPE